jgi:hypothetical protein
MPIWILFSLLTIGFPLKEKNAGNKCFGMFPIVDGAFSNQRMLTFIAPVFTHFGMNQILIDGRKFFRKPAVKSVDDLFVSFHAVTRRHFIALTVTGDIRWREVPWGTTATQRPQTRGDSPNRKPGDKELLLAEAPKKSAAPR